MANPNTTDNMRVFRDQDKYLLKQFPLFRGDQTEDVNEWLDSFAWIQQDIWWLIPAPPMGGYTVGAADKHRNKARLKFLCSKMISGGDAQRYWDQRPAINPVTGWCCFALRRYHHRFPPSFHQIDPTDLR